MAELRFGGGINELSDELVNDDECTEGENFLLDADSRDFKPRPSFILKGTATNAKPVTGIMQMITKADAVSTLIQAQETVYSWDGAASFTSKATVTTNSLLRHSYWSLDELLVITDLSKTTVVKKWSSTSVMSDLPHNIAGVTNLYAKYSAVYQNRVWLFNVKTDSTDNPHVALASAFEDYDNFNNGWTPTSTTLTANLPFYLTTPDLRAINGVATFFDTLVISTEDGKLFNLEGTDASNYRFKEFYAGSGATGYELISNIGNDVLYVRPGGHVERLLATDQYGDTRADDVSKTIQVETSGMNSGIMVYDRTNQRVCIFRSGSILVLDKYIMETGQLSPWMKWTTGMTSALNVQAATRIRRPGATTYSVYFGGPNGQIYDLNGGSSGDEGSTLIRAYRKSKLFSSLNTVDNVIEGRISYRRRGAFTGALTFEWTDEYADTQSNVPFKTTITSGGIDFWGSNSNPIYWGGDNYWNEGGIAQERVSTVGFDAVGKGPSFFVTLTCNTTVNFLIHKIEVPEGA